MLLLASGWAQESPDIRRFGNWEVLCSPSEEAAGRKSSPPHGASEACRAVQRLTVSETGQTVFVLTVLAGEKAGSVGIVSVPLGGYLVPGIEFSIDGKKPYKLLIETCTAAGCHGGFPLASSVNKELRTGKTATFRIWSTKDQSSEVKVSLNGFADAMDYLERKP
jgi:invasion protein IalB